MTKTMTWLRHTLQVNRNAHPVTSINYWQNCAERVWRPLCIGSDIWLQDDFWEASSPGFQHTSSWLKSLRSPGMNFMIVGSSGDAFVVSSCPFWSMFRIVMLGWRHTPLTIRLCSQLCMFLTRGVFECNIANRRSVAVLCMLWTVRCNPMQHLYDALPVPYVSVRVPRISVYLYTY